jgi:ATP-dependent Clp protease protease subunit
MRKSKTTETKTVETVEPTKVEPAKVEPSKTETKKSDEKSDKDKKNTPDMYSENSVGAFVDNYFLSQRAVWIDMDIDPEMCSEVIKQLNLWIDGTKLPVYIFINSPGGSMHVASAIVDTMKALEAAGSKVYTINVALAASAAAIIYSAGTKGCRYAYPSSRVMFHQGRYSGGLGEDLKAEDLEIYKRELDIANDMFVSLLATASGLNKVKVKELMSKDSYFSAKEAMKLGVVDKIKVFTLP